MTNAMRLNIEDSVERLVYINDQMKAARQFAAFQVLGEADTHVLLSDWEVFQEIRSIYGVTEMEIIDKRKEEPSGMGYSFYVKGLKFSYVAMKGEDGYVYE